MEIIGKLLGDEQSSLGKTLSEAGHWDRGVMVGTRQRGVVGVRVSANLRELMCVRLDWWGRGCGYIEYLWDNGGYGG